MEEQIKMARLNLELKRKTNEIKQRKQELEAVKHEMLVENEKKYHVNKHTLLAAIASIREKKAGLAYDDVTRLTLTDEIHNIEDQLNIIRDERDMEARRIVADIFAQRNEVEAEEREVMEWYEAEKLAIMEAQYEARKEAAMQEGGVQ